MGGIGKQQLSEAAAAERRGAAAGAAVAEEQCSRSARQCNRVAERHGNYDAVVVEW